MASIDQETRNNIVVAASESVNNIIYTVVFDTCNEMISAGMDQDRVLECANSVVSKYVEGGVKVRKKPAPRVKTVKAPERGKQVDTLTAASRKSNSSNLSKNFTWITHPDDNSFSYTTNVKLATGYPVKQNSTQKIVMVATDDASGPLTLADAKVAISYGLDIDYNNVQS